MLKRYNGTAKAWVDAEKNKRYDSAVKAWIDVKSAKTYDSAVKAWVERMYSGWFAIYTKDIQATDIFQMESNGFYFKNDISYLPARSRGIGFRGNIAIKNGDILEFDVNVNQNGNLGITAVYNSSYSAIYSKSRGGSAVNGHIRIPVSSLSSVVYDKLQISTGYSYDNGAYTAEAEIRNVTINGKKYGFTQ